MSNLIKVQKIEKRIPFMEEYFFGPIMLFTFFMTFIIGYLSLLGIGMILKKFRIIK